MHADFDIYMYTKSRQNRSYSELSNGHLFFYENDALTKNKISYFNSTNYINY